MTDDEKNERLSGEGDTNGETENREPFFDGACSSDGHTAPENGVENKDFNGRYGFYGEDSNEHVRTYYANDEKRNEYARELILHARERYVKTSLVFALLGLFFSLFYGLGIVFSVIAFVRSAAGLKKYKSSTLVWARALSITGALLSLIFIFAVTIFINKYFYFSL